MMFLRRSLNAVLWSATTNKICTAQTQRHIKRWVGPTLRELKHRAQKLGPQEPQPRSSFIEWNYRAELFAFGKRLNENFEFATLQTAFTTPAYLKAERERQVKLDVQEAELEIADNSALAEKGYIITKSYVEAFLNHNLPNLPVEGLKAYVDYLLSTNTLANVAKHIGIDDLILDAVYPSKSETKAQVLKSVIGALADSSGLERASLFIRDFICTQLDQKDLLELWNPKEPLQLLRDLCKQKNLGTPEPRLLGDCAKNTVLAAYHVGIYANKKLLAKGFGENVSIATQAATLSALQTFYDIHDNRRPFNFKLQIETKNLQLN